MKSSLNINSIKSIHESFKDDKTKLLIVFSAENCMPCLGLKRILNSYNPDFELSILYVNCTDNPEIGEMFEVDSMPTSIIVNRNLEVLERKKGFMAENTLNDFLVRNFVERI